MNIQPSNYNPAVKAGKDSSKKSLAAVLRLHSFLLLEAEARFPGPLEMILALGFSGPSRIRLSRGLGLKTATRVRIGKGGIDLL